MSHLDLHEVLELGRLQAGRVPLLAEVLRDASRVPRGVDGERLCAWCVWTDPVSLERDASLAAAALRDSSAPEREAPHPPAAAPRHGSHDGRGA